MLAAIGEFGRDRIKKRASESIARNKAVDLKLGARPKLSSDDITTLKTEVTFPTTNRNKLARSYGISRASVYRICTAGKVSAVPRQSNREDVRRHTSPRDCNGSTARLTVARRQRSVQTS